MKPTGAFPGSVRLPAEVHVAQQRHGLEQAGGAGRTLEGERLQERGGKLAHRRPALDQLGAHVHRLGLRDLLGLGDRAQERPPAHGALDRLGRVRPVLASGDEGASRTGEEPEMALGIAQRSRGIVRRPCAPPGATGRPSACRT